MPFRTLVWLRRQIDLGALARAFGHALLVASLLYTSILLAVDHHAAERIPTHEHVTIDGVVPPHVHGFEVPHTHNGGASVLDSRQPTLQISSQPVLALITIVEATVLAIISRPLGRLGQAPRFMAGAEAHALAPQQFPAPPTPPPPSLSFA